MNTSDRVPYTYTVLRYVHDVGTGEFMNIGVVISSQDGPYLRAKFKSAFGRVKNAFPSLDTEVFKARIRQLQASFDDIAEGDLIGKGGRETSVHKVVHSVVPADDSSLQWSPVGSGLSKDLEGTLETLFSKFVTRFDHDAMSEYRKKDEDVWKSFRTELEMRNVLPRLEQKTIEVADDSISFEHAWKNGEWHCYEPISFDLASDRSIKDKAHRWLGQLASVSGSRDAFKVYFLVGKPCNLKLHRAYEKALSILKKAPSTHVIEEDSAKEFSELVASAIQQHDQHLL